MAALEPRPLYEQLADDIAEQIARGELAPGQRLPGEPYLQQTHGVSRGTVRHAVAVLRDRGLVVTHAGKGTFVVDQPPT
jgi:GntR family transcriptional regulator